MGHDILVFILRLGLLAVLYFFLFQLLIVLWRDLRPPVVAAPEKPSAALEVLNPGDSGLTAGDLLPLTTVTGIGRSETNTIVLSDPSVSAEHALVSYRLGRWWVEDMGSTNGTLVNDMRIEQPTVLATGDVLRLGAVLLCARL